MILHEMSMTMLVGEEAKKSQGMSLPEMFYALRRILNNYMLLRIAKSQGTKYSVDRLKCHCQICFMYSQYSRYGQG